MFILGQCGKNQLLANKMCALRFPDSQRKPREEIFRKVLNRFLHTASVIYNKNSRSKGTLREGNEFNIVAAVVEEPHIINCSAFKLEFWHMCTLVRLVRLKKKISFIYTVCNCTRN